MLGIAKKDRYKVIAIYKTTLRCNGQHKHTYMATYISIVRGINVSGHKLIKMDALRQLCTNLGFQKVHTYIQSGNIIFQYKKTNPQILEKKIANAITEKFAFDVPVLVKEFDEFKQIVTSNPFVADKTKDVTHLHITFLASKPDLVHVNKMNDVQYLPDEFHLHNNAVYLYCPNGYSNTKLTNGFLENKLKTTATTRNWKTTNELINLADKINNL